jgi:hypothetical protein
LALRAKEGTVHVLAIVAAGLTLLGLIVLGLGWLAGIRRVRIAGAACLGVTATIFALLAFAEPTLCRALGGDVKPDGRHTSCQDEWGGNGNNDSGNPISFP